MFFHLANTSQSSRYTDLSPTSRTYGTENYLGEESLRGIAQLLSQIDQNRDRHEIRDIGLDASEPVLQLLQNQNLQESSDITRRRRMLDINRSRRLFSEPQLRRDQQRDQQRREQQRRDLQREQSRRDQRLRTTTVPFHSTHGEQISIGSDYRSARLHTHLQRLDGRPSRSAPVLFSAFQIGETWSVRATRNPATHHSSMIANELDPFSNWDQAFWFGVTSVNPAQITPELIFDQLTWYRGEALKDILHCVVCARPGMPMELFVEGQLVQRDNARNQRQFRERAGSIGAITFPDSTSSLQSADQKFSIRVRRGTNPITGSTSVRARTIQITSGSSSLSMHQTGRIPIDSDLPLYGIVILSDAVSHCEVNDSVDFVPSIRIVSNRISELDIRSFQNEARETLNGIEQRLPIRRPIPDQAFGEALDMLTDTTTLPLSRQFIQRSATSGSDISRTWRRRAVRLRENGPPNRHENEPIKIRSIMTLENVSFYHLTTRDGFQRLVYDLEDEKEVDYVTTSFVQKSDLFTVSIQSNCSTQPVSDIRIGFLPAHDFSVDESRHTQMDEFCLRPVESSCLLHNAHTFCLRNRLKKDSPILFDADSTKTYALGAEEIYNTFVESMCYSVHINEEKYCILSYREGAKWVNIARSIDPLPNRRKWVGFLSIRGRHEVQVFYQNRDSNKLEKNCSTVSIKEPLKFSPFQVSSKMSIIEEGSVGIQTDVANSTKTSIVGSRKMIRDELIEIRIDEINSNYVDGLEIGISESQHLDENAYKIKKGRLYKGSTPHQRDIPKMLNLIRGDRLGLVWRLSSSFSTPQIGTVHLFINGREVFELTSAISQPYPIWNLTGCVTKIRLISEPKRSSLWAPSFGQLTGRVAFYPFRHIFSPSVFRWSQQLKSSNVDIERCQIRGSAFLKTHDSLSLTNCQLKNGWVFTDWPPFGSSKTKSNFEVEITNLALTVQNNIKIVITSCIDSLESLQISHITDIPGTWESKSHFHLTKISYLK